MWEPISGNYVKEGWDMGVGCSACWREKVVERAERNGLRPGCLIAISSLRRETETTVVARCLTGSFPHSEEQI